MSLLARLLATVPALSLVACAQAGTTIDGSTGDDATTQIDACQSNCTADSDGDGVPDIGDQCPNTPSGEPVNQAGCSDSQVDPTLQPSFPPYGLTWNQTGDLGRPGGMRWTYDGIDRADLFHIYWLPCDETDPRCGLSLDGPIDNASEYWVYNEPQSNLAGGVMVFTSSTRVPLAAGGTVAVSSRMTLTIVDGNNQPVPFVTAGSLGITPRVGTHAAEILGTAFEVRAIAECQDASTTSWTPFADYYDNTSTPDPGPGYVVSLSGSFYDE